MTLDTEVLTEVLTLHFDLSHIAADTSFWISVGGVDFPLSVHTDQTRQQAQAENRALALVPAAHITHFIPDLALPSNAPQLVMVHSKARVEGSQLPTMEMTHVHLPCAARRKALACARQHNEHRIQVQPHPKLSAHNVAPALVDDPVIIDVHNWVTAMDAAATLVFFHMEMLSLDAETAALVHMQIEYSNGISDLAAVILRQAKEHAVDPNIRNYVYEGSYLDPWTLQPNGEPQYLWTDLTTTWSKGPMTSSLRETKNDPFLQSTDTLPRTWTVQPGTTWSGLPATQDDPSAARAAVVATEPWTLVNLTAGNGLEVGKISFDAASNTLKLPLKNYWLRWLSVYVQFLGPDGKPYNPPDWTPILPGPDLPTKKYIGLLASVPTILAIPLPAPFVDIEFVMPKGASKVNYFAGGLGRVNGINGVGQWDPDVCVNGTAMTAIFNLAIPTVGMIAGFSVSMTSLNALAKAVVKDVLVAIRLLYTESAASESLRQGNKGMWLQLANALLMALIATSPAIGVFLVTKFAEGAVKKATPIFGWIATAVSTAADAALIITTSVEVSQSPATFTLTAERKMNVLLTMLPDPKHQNLWPATATHFRVSLLYSPSTLSNGSSGYVFDATTDASGTPTTDIPMTVVEGPITMAMNGAPAGGTITLVASFYSNTNWLCGYYKSQPMAALPDAKGNLVIPAFHIAETLVPLDASTYYTPKKELTYSGGTHQWASGRFDIKSNVPALVTGLNGDTVTAELIAAFRASGNADLKATDSVITTRKGADGKGDQWLITGTTLCWHVNVIVPSSAAKFIDVSPGNTGTIKNLSGSNVGHNLADIAKVTLNQDSLNLGYTWQASGQNIPLVTGGGNYPGQMFSFQNINVGARPESALKFVPAGFPTRPLLIYDLYGPAANALTFYVDPRGDGFHVRKVILSSTGPFDLSVGQSFGRFNQQIDCAVVHPNGYIVGFNARSCKIEVLPLAKQAVPDKDAPLANLYAGWGSRPGLIHDPVGISVANNGTVFILENRSETASARVQAMDYLANPVYRFDGGKSPFLTLPSELEKTTYLDIATEVGGHIYLLKYLREGLRIEDYRLDIYGSDGKLVSQSVAVNAARISVSLWREMFTANFATLAGPDGRTEPTVSEWIPSTPAGNGTTIGSQA